MDRVAVRCDKCIVRTTVTQAEFNATNGLVPCWNVVKDEFGATRCGGILRSAIAHDAKAELLADIEQLEPDAIRALAFLSRRLLVGQRVYGRVDLATDPRDFVKERAEEIGDLLVYSAFAELVRALKQA